MVNLDFFETLYADPEFCAALGRMTLAAGRFESNVRAFLKLSGVIVPEKEATLGSLISKLKKHNLLSENGTEVVNTLKLQRNYLTHSLFDLFAERIEETVLPRTDLISMDVYTYIEKVAQLEENLNGLIAIVEKRVAELTDSKDTSRETDRLLFRP